LDEETKTAAPMGEGHTIEHSSSQPMRRGLQEVGGASRSSQPMRKGLLQEVGGLLETTASTVLLTVGLSILSDETLPL